MGARPGLAFEPLIPLNVQKLTFCLIRLSIINKWLLLCFCRDILSKLLCNDGFTKIHGVSQPVGRLVLNCNTGNKQKAYRLLSVFVAFVEDNATMSFGIVYHSSCKTEEALYWRNDTHNLCYLTVFIPNQFVPELVHHLPCSSRLFSIYMQSTN